MSTKNTVMLAGLPIRVLDFDFFERVPDCMARVTTLNAELIALCEEDRHFRRVVMSSYTCIDGQLPLLMTRIYNRRWRIRKVSGSDLVHVLAERCAQLGWRMFLLGGTEEENIGALRALRERFRVTIFGYSPPWAAYPFPENVVDAICQRIALARAEVLLVAFGSPKQELFLADQATYLDEIGVRFAVGVGGGIRIAAGLEKRAPLIVQRMGLEAFWRAMYDPKRVRRWPKALRYVPRWFREPSSAPRC